MSQQPVVSSETSVDSGCRLLCTDSRRGRRFHSDCQREDGTTFQGKLRKSACAGHEMCSFRGEKELRDASSGQGVVAEVQVRDYQRDQGRREAVELGRRARGLDEIAERSRARSINSGRLPQAEQPYLRVLSSWSFGASASVAPARAGEEMSEIGADDSSLSCELFLQDEQNP